MTSHRKGAPDPSGLEAWAELDAILIPVKHLDEAKQRLSRHLSQQDRVRLGLAMLSDVLTQAQQWDRCYVVTRDPKVRELCRRFRCEVLPERTTGLNEALALGTKHATAAGVRRLLILPADVPAVTTSDLKAIFSLPEDVIVASSSDGGTNALLRSPPDVVGTAFGPDSARAHIQAGQSAGLSVKHVELESLLLDVDDMDDLQRLSEAPENLLSVELAKDLVSAEPGRFRDRENNLKGGRLRTPDGPQTHPQRG